MYRTLLSKWKAKPAGSEEEHPMNDCLAIARDVFCAYNMPRCDSPQKSRQPLCTFMCDLWLERCPMEDQSICA